MTEQDLQPAKKALMWLFHFSRFLFNRFNEQRGLQTASSLAYTTLLSLVPLVTVMFGFLGGLPVFKNLSSEIQNFIFANFVPSFGDTVQNYLFEFSTKASQLTFTGTAFLLVIALMLMATIDNALNKIWHVKTRRNPMARFLVYWAVLTLGPLLVGAGLVATSYLLSLPALGDVYATFSLKAKLLRAMPFFLTSIAFTLLYVLVPNCFVYRRYALVGGVVAAILFEMSKFGFGIYVKTVPTYEAIYGAIAVIPIFLVWIYLSWVIVILGAHITYCLANFQLQDVGRSYGGDWDFTDVYKVIGLLWLAQKGGDSLSIPEFKKSGLHLSQNRISEILNLLHRHKWVSRSVGGRYQLTRDMSESTVADLFHILPCKFFRGKLVAPEDPWQRSIVDLQGSFNERIDELLAMPVRSLLEKVES